MDPIEIRTSETIDVSDFEWVGQDEAQGIALLKSADSEESSSDLPNDADDMISSEREEDGPPAYHKVNPEPMSEEIAQQNRDFRKKLNRETREVVSASIHKNVKLIVHRPNHLVENEREYDRLSHELLPIVREIARKARPLLQHEDDADFARNQYYGSKFLADRLAHRDYRYFAKKRPPMDSPTLVVGLRIDESASMAAFGRLEAAKRAAIAVYEFCRSCNIPIVIYGDTADVSRLEQMSVYAYADYDQPDPKDKFRLMGIRARSNNRDGMALRIMAERLVKTKQTTKLLISLSDGQPKAMETYTGHYAILDMRTTIADYERNGVTFLAAAIGQDKEVIHHIYGSERFLDISELTELPAKLVRLIARYL